MQCSVVEYLTTLIHSSISDETGTMQFLSSEVYFWEREKERESPDLTGTWSSAAVVLTCDIYYELYA